MQLIPIEKVIVGDRIRKAFANDVKVIADSMATEGQLTPILVRKLDDGQFRLVAGLHRLEAAKRLKWVMIDAVFLKTTGRARWDDLAEGIAECDENMKRVDLDLTTRAPFTARRTELTAERQALETHDDAIVAEQVAAAARAKAETKAEKAEAERVFQAARQARMRASKTAEVVKAVGTVSGLAKPETVPRQVQPKLPIGTLSKVSKEVGLSEVAIRHDLALVRTFGAEVLEIAGRVKLGSDKASSQAEMAALSRVKKEFPEEYERVIATWRAAVNGTPKAVPARPSSALRECLAKKTVDAMKEAGSLPDLGKLIDAVAACKGELIELRQRMTALRQYNFKGFPSDIRIMEGKLADMALFVRQVRDAEKVKVQGIR